MTSGTPITPLWPWQPSGRCTPQGPTDHAAACQPPSPPRLAGSAGRCQGWGESAPASGWQILDRCANSDVPELLRLARTLDAWHDELPAAFTPTGRRGIRNAPPKP